MLVDPQIAEKHVFRVLNALNMYPFFRCSEAERQLAQSRDLEGGLGFGGDDEEGDGYDESGAVGNNGGEKHWFLLCLSVMCASLKIALSSTPRF